MTPREILLQAAEKVRMGWCQGADARDEFGSPVHPRNDAACGWCASGAILHVCGDPKSMYPAWKRLRQYLETVDGVAKWNDAPGRTQAEVIAALEGAARECET